MTMIAAMGRISQIQATLQQLSSVSTERVTTTAAATTAAASPSADSFAATLAAALGTSATSATGSANGATGTDVVASAEKYLGVPYVFGGEDSSGMDCSGLVQTVYADIGIELPRLVSGQMKMGTEVASLAEAQPGDLIVTGGGDHILIYAGDNKVIHAPYPGRTVCLREAYMTDADITTIRRIIPITTQAAGTGSTDKLSAAFAAFAQQNSTATGSTL
ncbi:Cell wall-associated hydrolase, NlpC family [Cryobacterium flavum]|uniref:Cell wall-associated hydrolase, NlpC family n=1 Tax=Cryobacterium flavum TaxID=1424659 RepID=A0A4R8UYB8_9MICO|nr:C40 family peptidase [Cryobacterium flavum]TFB73029.1 NlpC/P60 family protein [Cryobacterium flavum]SDN02931.1 Cell wall-associated hydrolase, NlpC family [Cryobacterium flavum]